MPTGYKFQGEGSTKGVRQFVNLNQVWDHRATNKDGSPVERKNVVINVAQDDHTPENAQADSRLRYDIYDREAYNETKNSGNQRGVDSTISLHNSQWQELLDAGDIVEQKYETTTPDGKSVENTGKFLTFESDLSWTKYKDADGKVVKGVVPLTKTATAMEVPFDRQQHGAVIAEGKTLRAEARAAKATEAQTEVEDDFDLEP